MDTKQSRRALWRAGNFITVTPAGVTVPEVAEGSWEPYEIYMQAAVLWERDGEEGPDALLVVRFPADGTEDNHLHSHPLSDRVIDVVAGTGFFVCVRGRRVERHPLQAGMRVVMPRGVLHTFEAGPAGMEVLSLHSPFQGLEGDDAIVYPSKPGWGRFGGPFDNDNDNNSAANNGGQEAL